MRKLIIGIVCLTCFSVATSAAERFVGKTVSQVVRSLGGKLARGTLITEPPAVVRGIAFTAPKGVEVEVFIKRDQVPLAIEGGDNVDLLKNLRVIGFRKVENGKVYCEGDVLWHFEC